MNDEGRGCEVFTQIVERVLSAACFVVPSHDDVVVVAFDGAAWFGHADVAGCLLDPDECRRAARFRFPHDRLAYVLAHAVWRVVLGRCLGCEAAAVSIIHTAMGQPTLPGTPWATSLSHSGAWVAIAVGRVAALGVDLERSPPLHPLGNLVDTICTPQEAIAMARLGPIERELALLALWTRKEALLKAFGVGLSGPSPATLQVSPNAYLEPPAGMQGSPCRVRDLPLPEAVVGALAMAGVAGDCHLHILGPPMVHRSDE